MSRHLPRAIWQWRPSRRERKLFAGLALIATAGFGAHALDDMDQAEAAHAAASNRLARLRQDHATLSGDGLQAQLAAQKLQLSSLRMTDQTPQISRLRMHEELLDLATRAGLTGVAIVDDSTQDLAEDESTAAFTAIETSLEADFDQKALSGFLGQLEDYYRAYLVEGVEIRLSPAPARMVLRLRILHQRPELAR